MTDKEALAKLGQVTRLLKELGIGVAHERQDTGRFIVRPWHEYDEQHLHMALLEGFQDSLPHTAEVPDDPLAIRALRDLVEWQETMGGFDAECWRRAEALLVPISADPNEE